MNNTSDLEPTTEDLLNERFADPKTLHRQAAALTRRKLLRAAMECFATKGYQATTIREIAAMADVTMGAVYHHFDSKKDLLMKINRSRQVLSLENMKNALAGDGDFFPALRRGLRRLFKLLSQDPLLRGVTREYMGMAMIDPDVKKMHSQNDIEFREIYVSELDRRYPHLSHGQRSSLVHMILVAFEGLMTAIVVDSPMAAEPEKILDSFIDAFRQAIEDHKK
jgi:AcrR family transcriptional regulator